jgi:hypothetical protein
MWEFTTTQEICKLEKSRELISDDHKIYLFDMDDSEINDVDDLEMRNSSAPVRHHFLREHNLHQTYVQPKSEKTRQNEKLFWMACGNVTQPLLYQGYVLQS